MGCEEGHGVEAGSTAFYVNLGICFGLVITAGLMSGLTMGLMSLDLTTLRVIARTGEPKERSNAERIIPLVEKHHLLLVTLLLANASAMEALPIFLDKLVSPTLAIILSVSLVLMFGEIIPQAVCTRWGLSIGARMAYPVWGLMFVLSPIAWPIAKFLDLVLGSSHGTFFRRAELKELLRLHSSKGYESLESGHGSQRSNLGSGSGSINGSGGGGSGGGARGGGGSDDKQQGRVSPAPSAAPRETITDFECNVIAGAMDLHSKTALHAMTPISQVRSLSRDAILDGVTMADVLRFGHSRIPVHRPGDPAEIESVLLVKRLITLDPDTPCKVADLPRIVPLRFPASTPLTHILREMQRGSHLACITAEPEPSAEKAGQKRNKKRHRGGKGGKGPAATDVTRPLIDGEEPKSDPDDDIVDREVKERVIGIITMEDLFEEILGEEIFDESDNRRFMVCARVFRKQLAWRYKRNRDRRIGHPAAGADVSAN